MTEKEEKIEKSKNHAKKIIAGKTAEVKTQKVVLTTEAQKKAGQEIDLAKGELQKSKDQAQEVLPDKVVDLAQDISSKILGENIAISNVDKKLIKKIIEG